MRVWPIWKDGLLSRILFQSNDGQPSDGNVVWKRLDQGALKCNVEAVVFKNVGKFGLGYVIRNSEGGFVAVKAMRLRPIRNNVVDDSIVGMVISNCISLVKEIPNCTICFVRRTTNQVAHTLAKAFASMIGFSDDGCRPPNNAKASKSVQISQAGDGRLSWSSTKMFYVLE
ncbi:hypothetical protein PTKIN_Ptkin08bG0107200 [Pterospermum kingtungense]